MKKRKLLVVGWDGADWKIINKLMEQGDMPSMKYLVGNGTSGNLATLDPPFSPMLWTSIATGVRADKHGILGFTEPIPETIGVRPVSSTSRKVKAIWNILTQKGYKTHSVGWWPSHPAEPINGIMVSNHFQKMDDSKLTPMLKGTVHPPELSGLFSHFRIHPSELTKEHIVPFVPLAANVDQDKSKRLFHIAKNIAESSSIHSATTWIAENKEWDLITMYLDTIDHFSHGFMNFHPPKMKGISNEQYETYKDVINSAYKYHDMMLGRLIQIAGEDATIMLISDHGFHSDHLRPKILPDEPAGPAYQHRNYGIFCIKGPGIKKNEKIYGASLIDITPTILQLFDLPVGEDMDGVPLVQIFDKPKDIKTIPSWEDVEGNAGMLPEETQENPYDAQESLQQLVELGYIEEPDEDMQKNVENAIKEANYNLSRVYIGANQYQKALPILKKLFNNEPDKARFAFRLIECYTFLDEIDKKEKVLITFVEKVKSNILSKEELKIIANKKTPENLSEKEKENFNKKRFKKLSNNKQIYKDLIQADLIQADIFISKGEYKKSYEIYEKVEKVASNSRGLHVQIGNAYIKLQKWDKAIKSFNRVLEIDPENAKAFHGLAIGYFNKQDYENTIDQILNSINLHYKNPLAHFLLGKALFEINAFIEAENALKVCLTMAPNIGEARNLLIEIYLSHLNKPKEAEELKKYFNKEETEDKKNPSQTNNFEFDVDGNFVQSKQDKKNSKAKTIYIVSGLPRSGTSLMMQMIEKAGLEIYADNKREADESNPNGYYEHEAVKRLATDKKWLKNATGKTIKVIAQLLMQLPARYNYKIIFMHRNINEVVMSQHKMLLRNGKAKIKEDTFPSNLKNAFIKTIKKVLVWADLNHNVEILNVDFADVITEPENTAKKIIKYLNIDADYKEIASVIDNKLYRVRN